MKNIYIIFLLIPLFAFTQQSTIKVIGRSIHYDKTPIFKGDVTLSATFSSYPEEAVSLEQMKNQYETALKVHGLSLEDLTDDPLGYAQLRYDKEGMLYKYQTSSIKDFQGFLSSRSFGIQNLNFGYVFTIDSMEAVALVTEALENARKQAQSIASGMAKKLGPIISIEDKNLIDKEIKKGMYYDHVIGEHPYEITVVYAME